jgi:hypothetical protein
MTDDEIIDAYEELWRKAAMEDYRQYHHDPSQPSVTGTYGAGSCAALYPRDAAKRDDLLNAAINTRAPWICKACGWLALGLSSAMIHLNNRHGMTWDWFANKFREAWKEGLKK